MSVLYTFCHLWICFNLLFNCHFSKVMNIWCWQKGVSFFNPSTWPSVVFADYKNLFLPIQGISRCFWNREFLPVSSHYHAESDVATRPTAAVLVSRYFKCIYLGLTHYEVANFLERFYLNYFSFYFSSLFNDGKIILIRHQIKKDLEINKEGVLFYTIEI